MNGNHQRGVNPHPIRKYLIPATLAVFCAFSLLAGCRLQNFLTQTVGPTAFINPTETANAQITPTEIPASETPASATLLVIWLPPQFDPANGSTAAGILNERLTGFEKDHPQYRIEVRVKAATGKGGLLDALTTTSAVAPSALPSLIALPYPVMDGAAANGLLKPINDGSIDFKDPDWLPYSEGISKVNGQIYGIPFGSDILVLAYRPLQSPVPPSTWQQLVTQNKTIAFPAADNAAAVTTLIYLGAGGSLTDENGAPLLQKEALQKTFEILNSGAQNNVFPYWTAGFSDFDQSWNSFTDQQADYALIWASMYFQNMPENTAVTAVPAFNDSPLSMVMGWSWCIPANSPSDVQGSQLLAEYLSEPAFVNRWAQAAGYLPVHESGLESWKDKLDASLVLQLSNSDQLIPLITPNPVTAPLLTEATIEIVKKQTFYLQLLDSTLSHFQVK